MLRRTIKTAPALVAVLALGAAGTAAASGATSSSARHANATTHRSATKKASSRPKPNSSVKIGTAKVGKLGNVLVDGSGHVLYMYAPDKHKKVACNSSCQDVWPPVTAPKTGVAKATGRAKQSLIGSYKNPVNHKRIVTYNGWPLYTYVSDGAPGQANGQNLDVSGGYWWVIRPNGSIEK